MPPDELAALSEALAALIERVVEARLPRIDPEPERRPLAVSYSEAARLLGVSVSTVKRLVADRTLVPVELHGAKRLRTADLEALLGPPESPYESVYLMPRPAPESSVYRICRRESASRKQKTRRT